jgi:nitroimidazol reductase NimA-like FMN-containing flavoprotein (pyridoxamine 5'-phosphate oxidase superfamily)
MLEKMKSLVLRKDSCVLATTDGEAPHCSLMAYICCDSGERLFLVTPRSTRKFRNIRHHPRVSLLIDTRGEDQRHRTQALTVTGTCDVLQDADDIARIKATFIQQHPHLGDFIRKDDIAVVCVQVESLQLLDGPEQAYYESVAVRPPTGQTTD